MFKKISVFLVLVLVIGALSACVGSGGSNAELTEEKKKEISRAWLLYHKEVLDWDDDDDFRYYGNYNGYDMFFYDGGLQTQALWGYEIGGQNFSHSHSFQIYAYRNEKFYDLNEIKALHLIGIISKKSLAAMAETHREWILNNEI